MSGNQSTPPHIDAAELAALYVAGAMSSQERSSVEALLASGHPELVAEVRRLDAAARALGSAAQPMIPNPEVRDRLMRMITQQRETELSDGRSQIWREWRSNDLDALFTLKSDEGSWEETGVAGVHVRKLFVDRPNNRMTAMFRMAAGTSYPQHVHDGPEECYVLQGDLHVGDELIMHAGDYQRATPGSHHDTQWTESGCLLLVTSSLSDELV